MNLTDTQLIEKVRRSDRDAFRQLFEAFHPRLYQHLIYQCKEDALAQELAQETFFKIWMQRDQLKPSLSFYAYVVRIAENLLKDHYRHQQVRVQHQHKVRLHLYNSEVNPEDETHATFLKDAIQTAVQALPEKCKAIFIQSRIQGLSNQDIADAMGISKKTVENQLHHALKQIRKKIKNYL